MKTLKTSCEPLIYNFAAYQQQSQAEAAATAMSQETFRPSASTKTSGADWEALWQAPAWAWRSLITPHWWQATTINAKTKFFTGLSEPVGKQVEPCSSPLYVQRDESLTCTAPVDSKHCSTPVLEFTPHNAHYWRGNTTLCL